MPPKRRDRTTKGHAPSNASNRVFQGEMEAIFGRRRTPRPRDPYAITADIDPEARAGDGWDDTDDHRADVNEKREPWWQT